ncbi:MAG TPA: methylated-DNA--[protein]-cysteine S-methyltransferase [Gemmatimonadaceae bacterium]|nr:methylated-DNA--[protein]-cysteine S-methyltransferase [Gemmatimonadaceae bacterium]
MNTIVHPSPVGGLTLVSEAGALVACEFEGRTDSRSMRRHDGPDPVLDLARRELDAFFAGTLREFTVPVDPRGTDFQRRVWSALRAIPYGKTTSYGAIAVQVGAPDAVRAVGAANGANPIPIIIPCHRVIGANGSLTGFGGGLERKRFLLELERGELALL